MGNQLFQIWTLIHTANKENLPFYIEDQPTPPTFNPSHYPRVFYWETFLNELKVFVRKRYNAHATYKEQGFAYTPLVLSKNKTIRLNGYFQSYKYFEESKEKIYDFLHITEKKDKVSNGFPGEFFRFAVNEQKLHVQPIINLILLTLMDEHRQRGISGQSGFGFRPITHPSTHPTPKITYPILVLPVGE